MLLIGAFDDFNALQEPQMQGLTGSRKSGGKIQAAHTV
jgi:hypothetical protein